MKSKLGLYYISLGGMDVVGYLTTAKPRVVVSMEHSADKWKAAKQASPNTFIIGRHYLDDSEQIFDDDPEGRAELFFDAMKDEAERMRGIYDAWMGYNESVVQTTDAAQKLSRFYVRWGDLMRAAGFKSAAYSFATGNPYRGDPRPDGSLEPNLWSFLADGLRHCDLLSLHEYSAPTMDNLQPYLCLRYRKVMELLPADARRQIVITETGIDGGAGPANRPQEGWSKFTDAAGYVATLSWYDAELQKDNYVIGAAIFAMNGWGKDGSFGMADVTQIRDYIAQGGDPAPVVITQPVSAYTVQPIDTLYKIAKKFGVSVDAIVKTNNIANPSLIKPGQVLIIPVTGAAPVPSAPTPVPAPVPAQPDTPSPAPQPALPAGAATYTIKPGDTLYGISRKVGVTVDAIITANNLANPSLIKPGQVLIIPAKD